MPPRRASEITKDPERLRTIQDACGRHEPVYPQTKKKADSGPGGGFACAARPGGAGGLRWFRQSPDHLANGAAMAEWQGLPQGATPKPLRMDRTEGRAGLLPN